MPALTASQKGALADALKEYFPLRSEFDRAMLNFEKRAQARVAEGRAIPFSITMWIRGLMASQRLPALPRTDSQADLNYFLNHNDALARDLSTTATPGSYLVPTIQANEIIAYLADFGVLRRAGVRIIPMVGIEKLNFPMALASPTVQWLGENTAQSSSDPNIGQVPFALKTARSLTPIPNELLAVSVPAIDVIVTELLARGQGEAEDQAFFSTASIANGPNSLYSDVASLTSVLAGGSPNGGNLAYSDLLALMAASRKAKAKGPFVWFCSPRTLYSRITGLLDLLSRPIFDPNQVVQKLFGYPIFDTVWIPEDQAVGSGSGQSYMVLTNPTYLMIAEPGTIEIAVSTEFYFDKNQIAVRSVKRTDFNWGPPKGVAILKGIN